jgi:hypothetical protein
MSFYHTTDGNPLRDQRAAHPWLSLLAARLKTLLVGMLLRVFHISPPVAMALSALVLHMWPKMREA